jgi:predicted MFS family arabinose efflux permease
VAIRNLPRGQGLAFTALLIGNVALAMGPFLVRNSGVGPVSAGFWRVAIAVPFLWLLARLAKQPVRPADRRLGLVIFAGAFFFATDVAAWNAGIMLTKLGHAT